MIELMQESINLERDMTCAATKFARIHGSFGKAESRFDLSSYVTARNPAPEHREFQSIGSTMIFFAARTGAAPDIA